MTDAKREIGFILANERTKACVRARAVMRGGGLEIAGIERGRK